MKAHPTEPDTKHSKLQALAEVLPRIDTITFDCYGTLIDWREGLQRSLRELFGPACDRRLDELFAEYLRVEAELESGTYQSYRRILAQTAERLARQFGFDLPAGGGEWLPQFLPDWRPFADTNAALARLKTRFRLGVLSNIDRDLFAATSAHFSVPFDFVVTAEDVRSYKPGAGHFEALRTRDALAEKVLHVAQSLYHDGPACRRHELAFVWINRYKDLVDPAVPMLGEFPDLASFADAACFVAPGSGPRPPGSGALRMRKSDVS